MWAKARFATIAFLDALLRWQNRFASGRWRSAKCAASLKAQETVKVRGSVITILDDEALRSVAAGRPLAAHDAA